MFDINSNNLEKHFCDLFQLTSTKHSIRTRQATSGFFSQPAMRTNSIQNSVINNGVKMWNNIPKDIRLCKTKSTFKKFLKLWLLENKSL